MPGGQHTEVAQAYVTIIPSMQGAQKAIADGLNATAAGEKAGKDLGNGLKKGISTIGVALGNTLGNLMSKGLDSVMSGLDRGISRLDTIENYPKVMENLGYKTEDADHSIKSIMDHLDGLPTATDDMVSLTQSIADSTGDLDLATKAALGFNDMLLANGTSTADMVSATSMLNRVLGKQSATVQQWQSLQQHMPAQLSAVAEHMLGAGKTSEDLRLALEDGTVSWNDFLQAIVDLDETGEGKMASFAEQARSMTGGIGASIENVQNRIGAGWAAILKSIGREDIASTIDTISYGIRSGMYKVAEGISYLKDRIEGTNIGENLGKIGQGFADFLAGLVNSESLKAFADKLVDFIDRGLQWVVDHGDLVQSLLAGIGTALAFKAGIDAASKLSGIAGSLRAVGEVLPMVEGLKDLPAAFSLISEAGGPLSGMFSGLGSIVGFVAANPLVLLVGALAAAAGALAWWLTQTESGKQAWENFCGAVGGLVDGLKQDFDNAFGQIKQNIEDNKVQWQHFKENLAKSGEESRQAFESFCQNLESSLSTSWDNMIKDSKEQWATWRHDSAVQGEEMREKIVGKFEEIDKGIGEKLDWARRKAGEIVDGIKNLFNFEWSLPAPKLPQVKWHWNDIGGILSLPEFDGIEWYAKGAIFNAPTIAGLGEAGKEAALPLNRRSFQEIADGIERQMETTGITEDEVTEAVMRAITRLGGLRITINGRTMATALDSELGMLAFRGSA